MRKLEIQYFSENVNEGQIFSRKELETLLFNFFDRFEKRHISFAIMELIRRNIIYILERGVYIRSPKKKFTFTSDSLLEKIYNNYSPSISDICIYNYSFLYDFSSHIPNKNIYIVEVPDYNTEDLYFDLKERFANENIDILLSPTIDNLYYSTEKNIILIRKLLSSAPVNRKYISFGHIKNNNPTIKMIFPKIEKVLVDLFLDKTLTFFDINGDMKYIFRNILLKYQVNFSVLFNYAKRRGKKDVILKDYILNAVGFNYKTGGY